MAKKSVTKSKSAPKPLPKKYQFAGFNSSTYNQIANPYYVSGTYADQAKQQANYFYGQAGKFGDYASTSNMMADQAFKEREQAQQDAIAQTEEQKQQETQSFGQEAAKALGKEALSIGKEKLGERAAAKATGKAATKISREGARAIAAASAVAPTVTNVAPTITTAGQSLLPGAVEVGGDIAAAGQWGSAAASPALPSSLQGISAGLESGATTATTVALPAAERAALLGSNMSGLASAGIGLGLTGAGMLVQRKMDTDPTKYSKQEGRQNAWGDALKSAGTGFGIGATAGTALPGVGNVVGGIVGGIAGLGVGLAKGMKENKEMKKYSQEYAAEEARLTEEERIRKATLADQAQQVAQQYNNAFVKSRLTGLQTGFGYNTSTNMNMQPTNSFYGKTGGSLPGGQVVPIGEDAVKFVGKKHSQGGIQLDARTEVEGGETMDKVMMHGGKPNDYFFSAYLKLGGKSFAKRHEELVKSGANQAAIQDLAKKQEAVANKKGEKDRGPEQIAKYGGIHKYNSTMSPEDSAMAQSNKDAANVTLRDTNKAAANPPSDQQSAAPGKRTTNSGMLKQYAAGGKKQLPPGSLNYIDSTPWSSAFISYVYSNADPKFPKSPTHTGYATGLKGRDDWEELDPATTKLQPGDIIVNNRSGNKQKFGQDSYSGFSHGDIVTKIEGGKVYAIGGNVDPDNAADNTPDTVAERTKNVKDGVLADTGYFVVLRPKDPQIAKKAVEVATNEKQLWEKNNWNEHADTSQARLQTYYQAGKLGIPGVKPDDGKPAAAAVQAQADGQPMSAAEYARLNNGRQPLPSGAAQSVLGPIDYAALGVGRAIASGASSLIGAAAGAYEGMAGEAFAPNASAARPAAPTPNMAGRSPLRLEPPKPGTAVGPFTGNIGAAKPTVPARVVQTETGLVRQPPFYTDPNFINVEGRTIGLNKSPVIDNQMFKQFRIGPPEEKAAAADKAVELPPLTSKPRLPIPDSLTTKDGTLPVGDDKGLVTAQPTLEDKILEKETADKVEKEKEKQREKTTEPKNSGINSALLAGLGQLLPVGYLLANPYKQEGKLARMKSSGNVGATSVKGAILPRVNMNAERSAAERNTVAIKNAIQNQNAGPGGIAAMMAANSKQNQQMLDIANQEQRANRELAGEEARLGMQASMSNAEMAQRANMANVQNGLAVNQANLEASNMEAKLKIMEKQYGREEKLTALDNAASRIAGIVKDDRSYKAQERLANAMDDAGSYQRFQYYEQLKKEAKDSNSPHYGKTDAELKDYASKQYVDWVGTAKTGGRRYTSRLGELSKGRKTFNI